MLVIIAALLLVAVTAMLVKKYLAGRERTPVTDMKTGIITTVPDGAEIFVGDSLVGVTPSTFTLEPEEMITVKHDCCPDSTLPVDFESFEVRPIYLQTVVELTSDPSGATIILDGEVIIPVTPYRFGSSMRDTIDIALQLQGKPRLNLGKVAVAALGEYRSKSFDISSLSTGGYRIEGVFPGQPKAKQPKVSLTSSPTGAAVILAESGTVLGETPLHQHFGSNVVKLIITKAGYEDRTVNLPPLATRKSSYHFSLFRRVYVTAYEEGQIERTVNCRIKDVIYEGKSHEFAETTPVALRLPGVECRLILAADGYYDTDTLIAPMQKEITVVIRKREQEIEPPASTTAQTTEVTPSGKSEVKFFITDNNNVPVAGATVHAVVKINKVKQTLELGSTDADGKLVVDLYPGKYKFSIRHIDYKLGKKSKTIKLGQSYVLAVKIKRR